MIYKGGRNFHKEEHWKIEILANLCKNPQKILEDLDKLKSNTLRNGSLRSGLEAKIQNLGPMVALLLKELSSMIPEKLEDQKSWKKLFVEILQGKIMQGLQSDRFSKYKIKFLK